MLGEFRSTINKSRPPKEGATPHPSTYKSLPTLHPLCIIVVDVGSPHKINPFGMWKNGSHERDFGSFAATKRKEAKKEAKTQ